MKHATAKTFALIGEEAEKQYDVITGMDEYLIYLILLYLCHVKKKLYINK